VAYLIFDIETRQDPALMGSYYTDLDEHAGIPLIAQVPICIGVANVNGDMTLSGVAVRSVAGADPEPLVRHFWEVTEQGSATFVTFNGRGFDFPVLELWALRLRIPIPRYWQNCRDRYRGSRHIDLYDKLTNYGACRLRGGLDALSTIIGAPNKEVDASKMGELWEAGRISEIEDYCKADVLRTYLLFLRYMTMTGALNAARCVDLERKAVLV
jgi:3'-5' exonuclease